MGFSLHFCLHLNPTRLPFSRSIPISGSEPTRELRPHPFQASPGSARDSAPLWLCEGPLLTELGCPPPHPKPALSCSGIPRSRTPLVTRTHLPAALRSPPASPGWHLASEGAWVMVSGSLWAMSPPLSSGFRLSAISPFVGVFLGNP